mmetsp:Transcript_21742/g.44097  ORF Transcript_21742/g.44097 Transcript_21742/m.44097 type:complete len:86 (+) Transcript_21742:114-371(+)
MRQIQTAYTGNRATRKNSGCDKASHSGTVLRACDKKNGAGKGNWGRLMDDDSGPMDSHDPAYDPLERSFDRALWEHDRTPEQAGL